MSYSVIDLFSGAGGASCGFHAHPDFTIIAAADKQVGKPSSKLGTECNKTYERNIGVTPFNVDLGAVGAHELSDLFALKPGELDVLISCSPCTGFSRTNTQNHSVDDPRNSLTAKTSDFIDALQPKFFFIENARELLRGNFAYHGQNLIQRARQSGYTVFSSTHYLTEFGLPQIRERALILGTKLNCDPESLCLSRAWGQHLPDQSSLSVRNAIYDFPILKSGERDLTDKCHVTPSMTKPSADRLRLIPRDGGSWIDLLKHDDGFGYLIPSMIRNLESGRLGSYPDIYGRMWWDRPAPTIKRECSSPGNGRYCHPEQLRMASVRELSYLQGFPMDYEFHADSISNMYRHIGDSVPPMIAYQYAALISSTIKKCALGIDDLVMPKTFAERITIADKNEAPKVPDSKKSCMVAA